MTNNFTIKKLACFWLACFAMASLFLSFTHFKSTSNDSQYYTELVVRYQHAPFSELLTPRWGKNFWGFDQKSYMRDQFPGQLLMGAGLGHLGIPAEQALHILGMFFQVLSFLILALVAKKLKDNADASFLIIAILLTPLAFSYNIRANHELAIMFFVFLSLFSGFQLHRSKLWGISAILASSCLLLIKGPFFIFGLALFSIGFFFSSSRKNKIATYALFIFLIITGVVLTIYGHEFLFHKFTGEHFLKEFWKIQIQERALGQKTTHTFLIQKMINFYYYFIHYLAYSLPWSFILAIFLLAKKNWPTFINFTKSQLSLILLSSSMCFCLVFSLSDRIAARYTFPGYFLFTAWTALAIFSISSKLQIFINTHQKKILYLIPVIWLFNFLLHFIR